MRGRSLILLFFFFAFTLLNSVAVADSLELSGDLVFRLPGAKNFQKKSGEQLNFPEHTIFAVPPFLKEPLATNSKLIIASHSITLFPGATIKIAGGILYPLAGRISFSNENKEIAPIVLRGARYFCQYFHGELLVEVTPENTTWILMQNKGSGWVKDLTRKIVELQSGSEVEIPPFKPTKVREIPGSRWAKPPECAVVSNVNAVFYPALGDKTASDEPSLDGTEEETASDTNLLEDDEDHDPDPEEDGPEASEVETPLNETSEDN